MPECDVKPDSHNIVDEQHYKVHTLCSVRLFKAYSVCKIDEYLNIIDPMYRLIFYRNNT